MDRYKTNKQALIIAAIVILLCLVCLAGSTLALFTNDPNDGTIGIITTSGDVEVDIIDAATGASLVGGTLDFQTTAEQKDILFEPGAMFHTQGFKIENTGDVPIKYRLYVSKDEAEDKIDMQKFQETFDIWLSTSQHYLENAEKLSEFEGELGAEINDVSVTYFLFIKMKESADNDFQGKTYTGIGVTVYAIQGNAELGE